MTNTKKVSTSIIATLIAILIAASSMALISATNANAAAYEGSAQAHASQKTAIRQIPKKTVKINQFSKAYCFKADTKASDGDWTYKADTKNINVRCKYDVKICKYTFKFTGTSYGLSKLTVKYRVSAKKWACEKMTLFVDSKKNIIRTA